MFTRFRLASITSKQRTIYHQRFQKYQDPWTILHWSSKEVQFKRFEVLSEIAPLKHRTLLDVGCGFGDFFTYLSDQGIEATLYGNDIVEAFIHKAQKNHPKAHFFCQDLSLSVPSFTYDYAFCSGTFAFGDRLFFQSMTKCLYENATSGIAFNLFLATRDKRFFHTSIEAVQAYAKAIGVEKSVYVLGYLKGDVTFYWYKKV